MYAVEEIAVITMIQPLDVMKIAKLIIRNYVLYPQ